MAPIDEWLKTWVSAPDLKKRGQYRSPGPLHVYAMTAQGAGPQFSGPLSAWQDHARQLSSADVTLGLVAVETNVDHAYFKYPGVTLAFESPFGGSVLARDVMAILARVGVGGVLSETDQSGRFGVLRILMTPRWYAKSGDRLFGVDWSQVPNDPVHCESAKKTWALGIHAALRKALADIPAMCIDTVHFGAFDIVDWLHELGPRERTFLHGASPRQLGEALYNLGSYDLDELSSEQPRPFTEGGPLLTLYDTLEEAVTMDWLSGELASPDSLLLHLRGNVGAYNPELLLCLLRRQPDGRVRLATVTMTPDEPILIEDCFEVDPEYFQWPQDDSTQVKGADEILYAFVGRYADLHEPGTLLYRSPLISEASFRRAMLSWFCKSPSAGIVHELLSVPELRANPRARASAKEDAEERALEPAEAEELLAWLLKGDQQTLERLWLLNEWQQQWRPEGPEPDEIDKFLR
jgi:hypothetical protein